MGKLADRVAIITGADGEALAVYADVTRDASVTAMVEI